MTSRSLVAVLLQLTSSLAVQAVSAAAPIKSQLQGFFRGAPDSVLACPADGSPLSSDASVVGSQCRRFKVSAAGVRYPVSDSYADLLASSAQKRGLTAEELRDELFEAWSSRTQTQMFRTPFLAFVYERGWRQQFQAAGFPGIEKEYAEVLDFFSPADGGVVVDMSCGSGLMYRRLLRGGNYGRVLALDYSETMLRETRRRSLEEGVSASSIELCRADVAQLPLQTGSVDAMHAGAALHSWPRLEAGLKEIRRVIKPGGRLFATTFLQGAYGVRAPGQSGGGGSFRFFESEQELVDLLVAAGFSEAGVDVRREGRGCAIIKAVVDDDVA